MGCAAGEVETTDDFLSALRFFHCQLSSQQKWQQEVQNQPRPNAITANISLEVFPWYLEVNHEVNDSRTWVAFN
jgi:hypothetical protein